MNVVDGIEINKCTSCQMCSAVCSRKAITIKLNEDGFYRPYVDNSKCTNCGLCTNVCYKYDEDVKVTSKDCFSNIEVYSAEHLSDSLLKKVTSGGVADVLAKELIKQGYVCIGVKYNFDNHRAEHVIASSEDDTDAFRGSKYIQAYSFDALNVFVTNARSTKFAIFGLPCHIYAIDKYLKLRNIRDNCVLIDMFCHGCPSMLVWKKYKKEIISQIGSVNFNEVMFRSKVKGWGTFHISVGVDGKTTFVSNPHNDEFYTLFFSDLILNDACSECKLRSTMEYTDIRLGDFWGKRFLSNRKGVSAVAITTERGKRLFEAIKKQFTTAECSMEEVLVKQSYGKVYPINPVLRKVLLDALRDDSKSLKEIETLYYSKLGLVPNLKRLLKWIDWYLPFDLIRLLKRFA